MADSAMDTSGGSLGTSFPAPTDPNYYLGQTGLSSLQSQPMNANTLAAMFAPQGLQYTPANELATNPFLSLYMDAQNQALRKPGPQTGIYDQNSGAPNPPPQG